eukprot:gene18035-27778_t
MTSVPGAAKTRKKPTAAKGAAAEASDGPQQPERGNGSHPAAAAAGKAKQAKAAPGNTPPAAPAVRVPLVVLTDGRAKSRDGEASDDDKSCPSKKDTVPTCGHNSWDNVRVIKGQVTLRCRLCQIQWRAHVGAVWRKRKCQVFNTPEGCPAGVECPKLHLHPKKQSLRERVVCHGPDVLSHVPIEAFTTHALPEPTTAFAPNPTSVEKNAAPAKVAVPRASQTKTVSYIKPCEHNRWENVRVRKSLVTLRCRDCTMQWRQVSGTLDKCPEFPHCTKGVDCGHLHVYSWKGERKFEETPDLKAILAAARRARSESDASLLAEVASMPDLSPDEEPVLASFGASLNAARQAAASEQPTDPAAAEQQQQLLQQLAGPYAFPAAQPAAFGGFSAPPNPFAA